MVSNGRNISSAGRISSTRVGKEQNHKAEKPTEETFTVNAYQRSQKCSLGELTQNPPVEEVLLKLDANQLAYDKCGGNMKPYGKKFLLHELEIIPKQVILRFTPLPTPVTNVKRILVFHMQYL